MPPSLKSRISNIETWVNRLTRLYPILGISMELVKFDTQLMENPDICGIEYQQGELAGYDVREYPLEKWVGSVPTVQRQSFPCRSNTSLGRRALGFLTYTVSPYGHEI
jgi:RRXRR protein